MNRRVVTSAHGIKTPIIRHGCNLVDIVVDSVLAAEASGEITLHNNGVIGITEAIVAKSQGNFATIADIAQDVCDKFGEDAVVGVVFPILSRNRFFNILKGIAMGAKEVKVLLNYPQDEVGNPIMDILDLDFISDDLKKRVAHGFTAERFKRLTNNYVHPFTNVNYIELYESIPNVEVFVTQDPKIILSFTNNILVAEIHNKEITKKRIEKYGVDSTKVYTLADILSKSINGSGYNEQYGVLGSNLSKHNVLKLFPNNCKSLVEQIQAELLKKTGKNLSVLVYGDGAFKDPTLGIWELADPVVSPAYTPKLGDTSNEIKIKYVADSVCADLTDAETESKITALIKNKQNENNYTEGTTPRYYYNLLGSLCDLMSGSGDKGTPVVYIDGYFDNYTTE